MVNASEFAEISPAHLIQLERRPAFKRPLTEGGVRFNLHSDYEPAGDQPEAISELTAGLIQGERDQVLLGVTGSGKTFTVAQVIQNLQRPTLVLAPNNTVVSVPQKTLNSTCWLSKNILSYVELCGLIM